MDKDLIVKELENFKKEFYSSQVIMLTNTIGRFLSFATSANELMDIIMVCSKECSYDELMSATLANCAEGSLFILPSGNEKVITLVTGMLYAIDCGRINFAGLLSAVGLRHDVGVQDYQDFCRMVFIPYLDALIEQLGKSTVVIDSAASDIRNVPVFFPEKPAQDIAYWVAEMSNKVMGDNSIEGARKEFLIMLDGLKYAAEMANTVILRVVWIGLKHTLGDYKSISRELQNVENILKDYGVLEK